uniref:histidine kinase n=1 Tax=Kalanchoe fedtschenkoi TaxID=63787 RepID=A0A7N0TCI7_KALFE
MGIDMENDEMEEMEVEAVSSMWPEDVGDDLGKQFNIEKLGGNQDMLEEVTIKEDTTIVDFMRLSELTSYSEQGSSQLAYLVKSWESKQANVVRLLKEELDTLSKQREEYELKKLEIQEEHSFEKGRFGADKLVLDETIWKDSPRRKNQVLIQHDEIEVDAEHDTIAYWKQRAMHLQELLEASVKREKMLAEKMDENIKAMERQSSPVEEFSQILKRADNFLHFILQNAPVVIGHQDSELRYRFIYNHFPSFKEEDIIGKTDVEIFTGGGVKESQEFKKEVLDRGIPAKREITFDTPLFGSKTFLIYVEPVFSKAGETIGVNYMGMDVTDQVRKREKMAKLRENIAVQKAKETELNKTIHITEETMRAKQMLATMSHEIRCPLSGVVSMAEILSNTRLDREQKQLLDVMLSSGDLVLQLINDILDLSKVESGVMKLEATKFRPREVVKHVLQTAAASLKKKLTLEGHIEEDVPIEVVGDVLRIRQILTNLISNAVKFTNDGQVGIKLRVVNEPPVCNRANCAPHSDSDHSSGQKNDDFQFTSNTSSNGSQSQNEERSQTHNFHGKRRDVVDSECQMDEDKKNDQPETTIVWICCDVYDTGIGIPETALPSLFKKYMQVSADHARKYGGTGLGLAICKQLVELMGGFLTVSSKESVGSTFTFVLPYKVLCTPDNSEDSDDISDMTDHENVSNTDDITAGFFQFKPRELSNAYHRTPKYSLDNVGIKNLNDVNGLLVPTPAPFPFDDPTGQRKWESLAGTSEVTDVAESSHSCETSSRQVPNRAAILIDIKVSEHSDLQSLPQSGSIKPHERLLQPDQNGTSSLSIPIYTTETVTPLKPKILLVEDNKINVMVTQSMMKQLGHAIEVVNDGVEAVRAVQSCSYDLILMDVSMPVMNGLQATRLIRSFEETGSWDAAIESGIEPPLLPKSSNDCVPPLRRVPIVAMTANAMSESAEECYANGMDSFVSKPVTLRKLKECLEQYLL